MSGTFWCDLIANVVGGVVAGLAIVWVAEKTFGLRKERARRREEEERGRKRRRDERKQETDRALKYLGLLESEVGALAAWIPDQVEKVMSKEWGMAVPIVTPLWDLLEQSGDLVSLVNPNVLERTAYFYEEVEYTRHILDFLVQSWLVQEEGVANMNQKRLEMRNAVAGGLDMAKTSAKEVLALLEGEIALLEDHSQRLGEE